jgi:myogenesis-regulating glycosidase
LEKIRNETGINSFKFDAGEVNWLPKGFWLANASITPNEYTTAYARMAYHFGNQIEVRVASRTQDLPIFVRMLDKDSKWGFDNGLRSVITTGLIQSILGYPFILPGCG